MREPLFVGREEELTAYTGNLAGFSSSKKGFLSFVTGTHGIGKTSLLREMCSLTSDTDFYSSYGSSAKGDGLYPLGAMEDIIYDLACRGKGRDRIQELFYRRGLPVPGTVCTDQELAELEKTFNPDENLSGILTVEPELRRRHAIFDSVYRLLRGMCDEQPCVLFIDDMDKSDDLLWELVRHLLSLLNELPIALVCSFVENKRTEEGMNELIRIAVATGIETSHLQLKPFDEEVTGHYLDSMFEANSFTPEFVSQLADESEGNPLVLHEILVTLECTGGIYHEQGQWYCKPFESRAGVSVENIIFRRLAGLSERDIELLEIIAGLPEFFPLSILRSRKLQSYTGHNERDLLKGLCRFSEKFGLFSIKNGKGNLKFPFLRKTTVAELPDEVTLRDNEIVAEALEEVTDGKISPLTGIIANMYLAAGNYPAAIEHLERASRYLHTFSSVSGAIEFLQERLSALSSVVQDPEIARQLAETYSELARSYQLEGDWRKAVLNREAALPYLSAGGKDIEKIHAELSIAINCITGGKYDAAEKSLEGLYVSEFVPPEERVVASLVLSQLYSATQRSEKALAVLKLATAGTDNLKDFDPSLIARLLLATGNIWLERNEHLKADRMYTKAGEAASPGTTVYVNILCRRAEVAIASFAYEVAGNFLKEAWAISEKLSYLEGKADVAELTALQKQNSEPEIAVESLRMAYTFLVRLRNPVRLAKVCSRLGVIHRAQGDYQKAMFFLENAYSILLTDDCSSDQFLQTALAYGELVLSENKLYDSEEIFRKAGECAAKQRNEKAGAFAAFGLGKVFLAQRKTDKARESFDIAREFFQKSGMADRLAMVDKELRLLSL